MDVSIIIINWNTKEMLNECLDSIKKYTKDINYEVIIVDNNSSDGSINMLKDKFKEFIIIESKENLGFGRAHNLALPYINGKYTLLLNPDTLIKENSIKQMVEFMDKNRNVGLLSCKLLNADGSLQSSYWNFPNIREAIREAIVNMAKIPFDLTKKINDLKQIKVSSKEIECVMGAVMLLPSKLFLDINGFDDDYFMYGEDMDICWVIKNMGYKVFYYVDTEIYHIFGQSSKQINYWREVKTSSALKLFLRKRRGKAYEIIFRILKIILNTINILVYILFSFNKEYRYKIKSEFIKTICLIFNDKFLSKAFKV